MEVQVSSLNRRTLIRPVGAIQVTTLNEVRPSIEDGLRRGAVVVDLSAVDFIDSSGLGFFISFAKKPLFRGCFRLAAPRAAVFEIIRISRLDSILEIHETVADAVKKDPPRRILIVEPDEATRAVAEAVLESYDYSVQAVATIAEAVGIPFDLIVAGTVGNDELKGRMAAFGSPPLLLLVDAAGGTDAALESDLLAFLGRPFDPYDFLGKVRILLKDRVGGGAAILACIAQKQTADAIRFVLDRHGYRLTIVPTANAFAAQIDADAWSALLIDARPTGDSAENLVTLACHTADSPGPPALVLGQVTAEDIRRLIRAGVRDFLGVPVAPESLVGKLARYVKLPGV